MKVVNKLFLLVVMLLVVICNENAKALEINDIYYTNDNNVSFTKDEYDFVSKFYFDGYQRYMNQEDYDYMVDNNLMNGKIEIKEMSDDDVQTRASESYSTGSKTIKLSSSCTSTCSMTINLTWKGSPTIRSYDLVGAYSPTSNNLSFLNSRILYDGTTAQFTEKRVDTHGVSATMKLPSSGEDIIIIMNFKAKLGTRVYASYQHAQKNITLANSRRYSFLGSGYGGVFRFEEAVIDYYDGMTGVILNL